MNKMSNLNLKKIINKLKPENMQVQTSGFTLFVAMVVASLLLSVGFSIGNIILKQLLLAGSGKDSQVAFYAADSGLECVQFWDTKGADGVGLIDEGPFGSTTPVVDYIRCGSTNIPISYIKISNAAGEATSTLVINYSDSASAGGTTEGYKACAMVTIEKGFTTDNTIPNDPAQIPYTKITSRGYNSGYVAGGGSTLPQCDTSNPRTVERGLNAQY